MGCNETSGYCMSGVFCWIQERMSCCVVSRCEVQCGGVPCRVALKIGRCVVWCRGVQRSVVMRRVARSDYGNQSGGFFFALFAACIFFCCAGVIVRLLALPPLLAICLAMIKSGMSFWQCGQIIAGVYHIRLCCQSRMFPILDFILSMNTR